MRRNVLPLTAGSALIALLAGCSLSSPDKLAGPPALAGDATFTLLQTTDIHDHAQGVGPLSATAPAPIGSYARVAYYVDAVRAGAAATNPVVLVDSGDWTMGSVYDLTIGSQPLATFFLDTLRYDCTTLGNHEFDYTPAGLAKMLSLSQSTFGFHTPIVASNMVLNGNADLAPFMGTTILPSYTETLPNGLKIGFIGLMGKDAAADAPSSAPVSFTDYSRNYASIQTLVNDLRTTQGCHVVVALDHAGTDSATLGYTGEDIDLARNVTGIDVIASGHTHNPFGVGLDPSASHPVANGAWTTQVICAGAYSANVARLDLTYHFAGKYTSPTAATNLAMTDAVLSGGVAGKDLDPAESVFVGQADAKLNVGLASLFATIFPDYKATDPSTGIYHVVGVSSQDMKPNDINPVLSPNGLGNLCADADRNVPNGIISQVAANLVKAGWTGSPADPNLPAIMAAAGLAGYDLTPYTASVVPTGVVRDDLAASGPITFANVYQVLPLGISPDATQALPVGFPMMSAYLTLGDLKTLCGLQLVGQTNLIGSSYYLNFSGIGYTLDPAAANTYFKLATAAGVLQVTQAKAGGGSAAALAAMGALGTLGTDSGAALITAATGGNVYAQAMIQLNEPAATAANLGALGEVATLAATDAATGGNSLDSAIVGAAAAAVSQVSAFAATDPLCTGAAAPLTGATRYRISADLYGILMMGALKSRFGITLTPYADATSSTVISASDLAGAMAYRINAAPGKALVELKEWQALLGFLTTPAASGGLGGLIPPAYASSPTFTDFATPGAYGAAVTVRNASYPLANIGALMATLQNLQKAN